MIGRKQREWTDLAADPKFPWLVGRLLGANEMAVALLAREESETARQVADVLEGITAYFWEPSPGQTYRSSQGRSRPRPDEQPTAITHPVPGEN